MKIIKILASLFLLSIFISCDEEICVDHSASCHFCLINDSNHKILIKTLNADETIMFDSLYVDTFSLYQEKVGDSLPHPFEYPIVKLVYDDTVPICFFTPQQTYNRFNIRNKFNYIIQPDGLYGVKYVYTLTEADYQYALEHREENE